MALVRTLPYLLRWAKGSRAGICRVDVTTGERRLWKDIRPADPSGLNIQRVVMTADGQICVYAATRTLSRLFLVEGLK